MIEVFKTNVRARSHANMLVGQIHKVFNGYEANFDLDDCDKVLRIESSGIRPGAVEYLLQTAGFYCRELDY